MEQTNEQPIESVQSSKNIWITVIAVIITALIVGGGVYVWQRSNLKSTEQELQQQISVLQDKINQLQQPPQSDQTLPSVNQNQQPEQKVIHQDEPSLNEDKPTDDQSIIENNLDYINSSGKYGFNYPRDWTIETNGTSASINGGKFAGTGIVSYRGLIDNYLKFLADKTQIQISNKKDIQIAGTTGVTYTQSNYSPAGLHYLIQRGDEIITIFLSDGYTQGDLDKFNIIINSFTLLK